MSFAACTSYQHEKLKKRKLGYIPDQNIQALTNTDSVLSVLQEIPDTKTRLDSLLNLTDLLKFYENEAALTYANEAYRIAIEKNYRFSQAISMYYRALLKSRDQTIRRDLEDALADAKISYRLLRDSDDDRWNIQIREFLGLTYLWNMAYDITFIDSARFYANEALEFANNSSLPKADLAYYKGYIYLLITGINQVSDTSQTLSSFRSSIREAERSGNQALLSAVWADLGHFYTSRTQYDSAEKALVRSLELGLKAKDPSTLVNIYQNLATLKNRQYLKFGQEGYFQESMDFISKCLDIQKRNLSYTYLLKAYNYQKKYSFAYYQNKYVPELDSTIKYYQKAAIEASKEGTGGVVRNVGNALAELCKERLELTGSDCDELFPETRNLPNFLSSNYASIVNLIRKEGLEANERLRESESRELKAINSRRVRSVWLISGIGLLIAGLIFLLLIQNQQRKKLQARMEALRAQINPHFMSNSLNAIENLINSNQKEAASKYLIHFSRLSRRILSSSRSATISLEEELKTLKHFLALEQLRLREKLSYEIQIASGLKPELIEVPGLILQPYVENAIWHGIKPKDGSGFLKIQVERQGKQLICMIEDDGIGREKSREIKENSVLAKQHKSQGMKITEERLKAFAKVKGSYVEIIDLYDNEDQGTGTRVIVKLPFKLFKTRQSSNGILK